MVFLLCPTCYWDFKAHVRCPYLKYLVVLLKMVMLSGHIAEPRLHLLKTCLTYVFSASGSYMHFVFYGILTCRYLSMVSGFCPDVTLDGRL